MRRRQLILIHLFFFIGSLLIFVVGPFYSNYESENLAGGEEKRVYTESLNFSSKQDYILLNSTPLDWYSFVNVSLISTQPAHVVIQDSMGFHVKSFFGKDIITDPPYYVFEPNNFTVTAEGLEGTANSIVTVYPSIVTRDKPYAFWGLIMHYGGIVLIVASVFSILRQWARRKPPSPKQQQKDATVAKKLEKKR